MESSLTSSNICFNPLFQKQTISSLKTLTSIVETSIGPCGKLKLIKNINGYSITVTSSSQRLFHHISTKNIFSKIIISAAKSHLKSFNDGGLTCALLTLKLISNSMFLPYPLPSIGALYSYFGKLYIECLGSENNACAFTIDFSDLCHLQSVVYSLLSSKSGCVLNLETQTHLCTLLLEGFLNVVPQSQSLMDDYNIRLLTACGSYAKDSQLFKGLLVHISKTDFGVHLDKISLSGPLKVIIFTVSLSGDEDIPLKNVEVNCNNSFSGTVLKFLEEIVTKIVKEGVHLVFCQKVIHPRLKKQLLDEGILVFDRLGADAAKYIQYISGGFANSSIYSEFVYGTLTGAEKELLGKDHFMLLHNDSIQFFTLLICHFNTEAANDLKVVCRQVIDKLFHILKSSKICFGAGCTETYMAHLLVREVKENMSTIKDETGFSAGLIEEALRHFLRSIMNVCVAIHQGTMLDYVTENIFGHLWKLKDQNFPTSGDRCQCGSIEADNFDHSSWIFLSDISGSPKPFDRRSFSKACVLSSSVILDELSCKRNIASLAFETAVLLLKTSICVNNSSLSIQ